MRSVHATASAWFSAGCVGFGSFESQGGAVMANIHEILNQVEQLPHDWHICGSMSRECLRAIVRIAGRRTIQHSVETGSGKTTLLFSHLSRDHKVFSIDNISGFANNSISVVKDSELFNARNVEWIEGPSQRT